MDDYRYTDSQMTTRGAILALTDIIHSLHYCTNSFLLQMQTILGMQHSPIT